MGCFVLKGVNPSLRMESIYQGGLLFMLPILTLIGLLVAFPDIALLLPRLEHGHPESDFQHLFMAEFRTELRLFCFPVLREGVTARDCHAGVFQRRMKRLVLCVFVLDGKPDGKLPEPGFAARF
jgi:hypothetical protein